MIGRTNIGGGGGGAGNTIGYIGVVYPAGSTVTCTKGTKTLIAKDTSGLYVFLIPEIGVWTVTATYRTSTFTQDVEITTMWQDVVVTVSYWDGTMFDAGDQYEAFTGGWAKDNIWSQGGNVSFTNNEIVVSGGNSTTTRAGASILNPVDITDADSITITVRSISDPQNGYLRFLKRRYGESTVSSDDIIRAGTKTIPLSELSGSYYLGFGIKRYTAYITKVKLNFTS